ncbi:MAG: UDP-2,3-diacylglucosamine diphosphatase LpxI [Pseudomonadota bacterium]
MLALIAGTGDLPVALQSRLHGPHLVCAMAGFTPSIPVDLTFRIEHLGSFIAALKARGVTQVCMAGAVRRPPVDPSQIDGPTAPLVPQIQKALTSGDDGALRAIIAIFEAAEIKILAAHEIAPGLLPDPGVLTLMQPPLAVAEAAPKGDASLADMGVKDAGQACIVTAEEVILREDANGTDAMIARYKGSDPTTFMMKGPKPNQDLRADMPVIGLSTAQNIIAAGLAGIVVEAGGVMVMDQAEVTALFNTHQKFLWVRPRGGA